VLVERLARAGSGAQQAAAYRLRIQPRQWEIDLPTALARRLLEVPIEAQFRALSVIADVDREAASAVFRQVAPHGWITAMAAEQVRDAAGRAHGERGLGVNAACVETCNMHVRCAFHAWSTCEVEGNPSDDDIDEFMRRARAALLQWMQHDHDEPEPQDREIDAEVAESQDDLPFLVLPPDAAFSAVLARIRDAWPHVPVMLRCTGDSLEPLAGRGLPHIALLDPPIVPAVEASIIAQHRDYVRRLDRRARG
jgi:hypothetical protein